MAKTLSSIWQRKIRSIGVSISSEELQQKVLKWTTEVTEASGSKENTHIVLFNSHEASLAHRFKEANYASLGVLESYMECANRQRDVFIMDPHVSTFHASAHDDIIAPSKAKPLNPKFVNRLLNPPAYYKTKSSILVGCFPILSQQLSIVEALFNQLLIHSRRIANGRSWVDRVTDEHTDRMPDFYPSKTIYECAKFKLITFLSPFVLCKLVCSREDDMEFFARQHSHFSALFNILFDVKQLTDREGFGAEHFNPVSPEVTHASYEQRLRGIGFDRDKVYPVVISPRDAMSVVEKFSQNNYDNAAVLFELALWMEFTAQLSRTSLVMQQIREKFGSTTPQIFDDSVELDSITPADFVKAFGSARSLFRTQVGLRMFDQAVQKLVRSKAGEYDD